MGVALRVAHYLRNPEVWHDEAALLVNVVERGYGRLLEPLTYHEAAPPLFMWLERWLAVHVSDGTAIMRLLPLLASCGALVLMLPMTRVIRPAFAPVALVLMACSSKLVAHSVEAKPYAVDVLLATLVGSTFVLTREWSLSRRLLLFTALAPVLVWASYPGMFLAGGIACALLIPLARDRHPASWLAFLAFLLATSLSVAILVDVVVRAQRSPEILANWQWAFPTGSDPLAIGIWLLRSVIGVADYCFRPLGGILLIPIGIGIGVLIQRGERALVALLVVPLALAAAAGLAGQYPFSGSRTMIFALPALSILAAEGAAAILTGLGDRRRLQLAAMAVTVLPPIVMCASELIRPWTRPETAAAAEIVLAARRPGEMVASGNWEYRYYFRALGSHFVPLNEQPLPAGQHRVWWVLHGPTATARRAHAATVAAGTYRMVSSVELRGVSIIELGARP